jgi:uncharacterized protein YyaL (SSP411 family)
MTAGRALRALALGTVVVALLAWARTPPSLETRLRAALAAQGPDYVPRTHHLNPDGSPIYVNRLMLEASPYLLQHAHNPVDWYPWGDAAFAKARAENKPVLLSVGYSTCHWCHVMERESFEDAEIAAYLNEHYVAIKVDREERPDVDAIYMAAVHHMAGRGGWPMTVWLTADRKPFYAGTYFPPRTGARGARTGFIELLRQLRKFHDEDPAKVAAAATDIAERVAASLRVEPAEALPSAAPLRVAFQQAVESFDAEWGGFGSAPKFPSTVRLEFLLRYHRRTADARALDMVTRTLEAMARGGIHDHVGGGFHRYSTDRQWLVPHFEKMLYDNALLTVAFLEAHQVTRRAEFADVVRSTLAYVEREMTDPAGGFYAASDADSEGEEGTFFVWTPAQIRTALPPEQAEVALAYFAVTEQGNFEGRNILHTPEPLAAVAARLGRAPDDAQRQLDAARTALRRARATRVPPHTDHKVITAWNGLMISAFARASRALGEPRFAAVATRAADGVLRRLGDGDRLRRHALGARATGTGFLDDYAFLIAGLLDLHEATFESRWLERAIALQGTLDAHFADDAGGGYFATPGDHEALLAREKPDYDGAEPSGNAVALQNLLRLHSLTTDDAYRARADALLRAFGRGLQRRPSAMARLLVGLDYRLDRAKEIIIVTPATRDAAAPLLQQLRETFVPNHVLVVVPAGAEQDAVARRIPLVADTIVTNGKPTAYVCEERLCELPTTDPAVFSRQIARVEPFE